MKKWFAVLAVALACKAGYVPSDTPGVCIEQAVDVSSQWRSDEKPPEDKMPSWQREGIVVINAPPGVEPSPDTAHDFKAEREQR